MLYSIVFNYLKLPNLIRWLCGYYFSVYSIICFWVYLKNGANFKRDKRVKGINYLIF